MTAQWQIVACVSGLCSNSCKQTAAFFVRRKVNEDEARDNNRIPILIVLGDKYESLCLCVEGGEGKMANSHL